MKQTNHFDYVEDRGDHKKTTTNKLVKKKKKKKKSCIKWDYIENPILIYALKLRTIMLNN